MANLFKQHPFSLMLAIAISPLLAPRLSSANVPCSEYFWGEGPFTVAQQWILFGISLTGSVMAVVRTRTALTAILFLLTAALSQVPFALYHSKIVDTDPRYTFPASISHTIRRPAPAR